MNCFYCNRRFGVPPFNSNTPLKRTKDHIIAKSRGGLDHKVNYVDACNKCNALKGHKTLDEFEKFLLNIIAKNRTTYNGWLVSTLRTICKNVQVLKIREQELKRSVATKFNSSTSASNKRIN